MIIKDCIKLFFRGYGIYVEESNVVFFVVGMIERVNKFIFVRLFCLRWVYFCEYLYGKDGFVLC